MKRRLVFILGLIVLLPLTVLVGFGIAVARQEKARAQSRYEQVLVGRLSDINSGIAKLVEVHQRELLQILELPTFEPDRIRAQVRTSRLARQLFVIAPTGDLLHPQKGGVLTAEERAFLERTESLWESGESFWIPEEIAATSKKRAIKGRKRVIRANDSGWHTWFWGEGLRLIFWVRRPTGHIVGAEVERAAMMSDVIAQLPVADYTRTPLPKGRIVLVDAQSRPLYQWGAFQPAKGTLPTVAQNLPAPFTAWSLHYFVPANGIGAALGRSAIFNIVTGLSALALSLIALATYFYRESSRDMHEASRRVTFVNQVSHELKTPLTNIRMYAELLEQRISEEDKRCRSYIDVLVAETQRLSRLITNVLTFATQRRGNLKLHPKTACVDSVIANVIASFDPALRAMGIEVVLEGKADRPVALDVDALEQILGNIISNVEKYATQATTLRLHREQHAGTTVVTVSDDGPGVPAAQRDTIFRPFVRLSNKLTDGVSGTGIGLTISRRLAMLHGGTLSLVPTASGATFKLTLKTPEANA
ncbi:MAG: HAMP domain-containing histidine kinase [Verrucomicrobia bacterium]|jgi:signal transduction histidine kinase|nr:HAMP domain-containing histidine kinase [Verrucomicrobiota bacterium]